ncbi:MAG: hypothetical protein ACTSQI_07705 [Candidatus Helarchaeota archaeon]
MSLNDVTIPEFYIAFLRKYLDLGLYPSFSAIFTEAIRDLIKKQENFLCELKISKLYNEIAIFKDECSNCEREGKPLVCKSCLASLNNQVNIRLTKISDLKKVLAK